MESVDPGSNADSAGLMAGDVLLKAAGRPLNEAMDLHFAAMAASRLNKPLELTVRRDGQTITLAVPLASPKD